MRRSTHRSNEPASVDIVRSVVRREAPVTAPGPNSPLPLPGGAGKPLKPNVRPLRSDVPVYLAAMGPRNVALAAEIADGWIPFLYSPEQPAAFADAVADGSSRRAPGLADLDVAPMVPVAFDPELGSCRDELRPLLALYAGGMGSAGANDVAREGSGRPNGSGARRSGGVTDGTAPGRLREFRGCS